jgi:malonyl-CoA O-methyltransferase
MKPQERAKMSKVIKEFSRFAHQYNQHNEIQAQVAKTLVSKLPARTFKNILDLGCGSGAVVKNLKENEYTYTTLTAFDSSQAMLDIHPDSEKIIKVCGDFNSVNFTEALPQTQYDLLLSSSALQWSTDLDRTFSLLSGLSQSAYFAIFTSGTFKTLHGLAKVSSPIYSAEVIEESIEKYYNDANFALHTYTLAFDSVREMFRYIKKSGVSAGEKKLGFKETKHLMENYPLDHLEFEVLFVEAKNM